MHDARLSVASLRNFIFAKDRAYDLIELSSRMNDIMGALPNRN